MVYKLKDIVSASQQNQNVNDNSLQIMVDLSSTINILQGDKFLVRQKESDISFISYAVK